MSHRLGMARLGRWFHGRRIAGAARQHPGAALSLELDGVLRITCAEDDRIEASIVSRIRTAGRAPRRTRDDDSHRWPAVDPDLAHGETQVDIRCRSSAALAQAEPFVWLQLVDDGGAPFTHEMLLGRGVGNHYEFHARFEVPSRAAPFAAPTPGMERRPAGASPAPARPSSGLHARVVTRTFRNGCGPQYHMEVLTLTLLKAGDARLDVVQAPGRMPLREPSLPRVVPELRLHHTPAVTAITG